MRQFQMMNQSITMQPNGLRHLTMIGAARGGAPKTPIYRHGR
jgi:hypothetical protein